MLQAFNKWSTTFQQSLESILDHPSEESLKEVKVYKEMLVESEFEHLKIFRSLEKLIIEKNSTIDKLKLSHPEIDIHGNQENLSTQANCHQLVDYKKSSLEQPPEEIQIDDWQKQIIKRNIEEKLDAIAEARIQKDMVTALQEQMFLLKEHVREQDRSMENLRNVKVVNS